MDQQLTGLTQQEVIKRLDKKSANSCTITKTTSQIIKENVFTLFNFLNFAIAILLFIAKAYSNMAFIVIIICNILIGIIQELKAKKQVDELSLLNSPEVHVIRDGQEQSIRAEDTVEDDLMILESGRQICSDAIIVSGSLEVNESLLTGESDAIIKEAGDALLSGSSVISGKCVARVTHAGSDSYIGKLSDAVKAEKATSSELLDSMKKVTRFTSFLIIPLGILLFIEAYVLRQTPYNSSIVASAAALLGMLPKGLVLLISVSLANGVIRLAKKKILVQNIYSLETLAHVDVLCLDKTGTLTDGQLKVKKTYYQGDLSQKSEAKQLLSSYLAITDDNNTTMQALKAYLPVKNIYESKEKIPFSSKRKWGAISFYGHGSLYVGAPDRLFDQTPEKVQEALAQGDRVLAVAYSQQETIDEKLPQDLVPLFVVILEDHIRKNVKETLDYFYQQGVDVKVISGDHVKTVSMVAKKAGLGSYDRAIDLSTLQGNIDYESICDKYDVFARVTPKQKEALVKALQAKGHRVAMTGDGVNDLLALRHADCSIAVAQGSDASRQIAQIVLLESDFTYLPQVVEEGRKVVNNVTRTAGVFFIKTIYSLLLSFICLLGNFAFPFIPIRITLIDAAMEAYPSFLTIFESDTRKIKGSFLKTALGNALPFALVATSMMAFVGLHFHFAIGEKQTMMYLLLILTTMTAVIKSCLPMTPLRGFICTTMVIGVAFALMLFPSLLEITTLAPMQLGLTGVIFIMGLILITIIMFVKEMVSANN